MPDVDLNLAVVAALRQRGGLLGDKPQKIILLLDHRQHLLETFHVVILRIGKQTVDTLELQLTAAKGGERFVDSLGHRIHQIGVNAHAALHIHQQRQIDLIRRDGDKALVERPRQKRGGFLGDRRFAEDVLALDHAAGHDHHQHQLALLHADNLVAGHHISHIARAECQSGVVRHGRRQPHGFLQNGIQFRLTGAQRGFQLRNLVGGHIVFFNEGIHIEAVARLAGNAPCGGVGLFQIAHLLQLRHLVADRSRRKGDLLILHQILAAYRLAHLDMCLDNRFQDLFFPVAQFSRLHFFVRPPFRFDVLALDLLKC